MGINEGAIWFSEFIGKLAYNIVFWRDWDDFSKLLLLIIVIIIIATFQFLRYMSKIEKQKNMLRRYT